jgi:pimeloyl-ACP methyl ester carboxylesterase
MAERIHYGEDPLQFAELSVHAARLCGDDAELIALNGASHFDVVDPRTKEFARVRQAVVEMISE